MIALKVVLLKVVLLKMSLLKRLGCGLSCKKSWLRSFALEEISIIAKMIAFVCSRSSPGYNLMMS